MAEVVRVRVLVDYADGTTAEVMSVGPASGFNVARRRAGATGPVRYHWTLTVYDVPPDSREGEGP